VEDAAGESSAEVDDGADDELVDAKGKSVESNEEEENEKVVEEIVEVNGTVDIVPSEVGEEVVV
jgi:hypothetical protein